MPCYDDRPDKERQIAVRLACCFCQTLENCEIPIPDWAEEWWKDHKSWDEKRKAKGE